MLADLFHGDRVPIREEEVAGIAVHRKEAVRVESSRTASVSAMAVE
jgi:hypothetical protein